MSDIREKFKLPKDGKRILCALSGGADSMCLLALLLEKSEETGLEIRAAHFEHGIRGAESLRDADFVRAQCEKLGVTLVTGHGSVPEYAEKMHLGTEEAARKLRYKFLKDTAKKLGCDYIATAHNAEDNAETMLLNLSRGSGGRGLCGIPPIRGRIIRPMLAIDRGEILAYLEEKGIPHVEDSSNASDEYSRNILRHRVIPVLRGLNPEFTSAALRTAGLLRQDEDFISGEAEKFIKEYFDGESLDIKAFAALHPAVSARVVRALCEENLSAVHVEAVQALAQGSGLGFADVPGLRVRREQGRLYFKEREYAKLPDRRIIPGEDLELPEAGLVLKSRYSVYGGEIYDLFKTCCIKCESISGNLFCTGRRNGDSLRPQGRGCRKTLKSLFTEKKYNQRRRDLSPVIRDEEKVLAVLGLAADESCRPRRGDRVLWIETEKKI
ncbi:MAG: tRNA lysidine(34) synthetase TilS [Candidatus Limivicinus sp.]|jgi:tRNA(Ile)-lysidine synthase